MVHRGKVPPLKALSLRDCNRSSAVKGIQEIRLLTDLRAEQEQLTKEYYKPYVAATEPLWIKPRELNFFNRMPAGWIKAKPENMKAGWM